MPNRNKRKIEEFDPNKSDSADSTYGASASRSARAKPARSRHGKPSRKKQRRGYDDDDDGSDDMSVESEPSEASFDEPIEEEPEFDITSGRPKRKAAKQRPTYQEDDTDESIEEAPDSAAEGIGKPNKKEEPKSLLLKLKTPARKSTQTRRSTRGRSGSIGANHNSSEPQRRSSRIAHDDSHTMVQLTDSGHHADIVRQGTRSPETAVPRPKRGSKGVKKLPASIVYEEEEENSAQVDKQTEIAASHDDLEDEPDETQPLLKSDMPNQGDNQLLPEVISNEVAVIPESGGEDEPAGEDDDEDVVTKPRRANRKNDKKQIDASADEAPSPSRDSRLTAREDPRPARPTRKTRSSQKSGREESSDFEPGFEEGGEEDVSDSEASIHSPQKANRQNEEDNGSPGTRGASKGRLRSQRGQPSDEHDSEVAEELAEELQDLQTNRPRRVPRSEILYDDRPKTRKRKPVDYRILRPDLNPPLEDDGPPSATTPSRKGRTGAGGTWQRTWFNTYGPFGGAGGPPPVFGGPSGIAAAAGADSDSSDDENLQRPRAPGIGGAFGMTPTVTAPAGFGLFPQGQAHGSDPVQGTSGTPANLGKIKDKQLLADADPLGVDQNVNFDSVGGLQGHIDQLKEMVALPLLYPEVFQRFHVTPPRGVLFHGPPGTGKTLLARALASSVSSHGRKVTFYMRKGADALSKWVGEAERQLRLLFDEARKTQPSIIFFDEIDGNCLLLVVFHRC